MLNQDYYVREKLRELEREQLTHPSLQAAPRRQAVISPFVRGTGRLLRRLGEGLESWAARPAADDAPMRVERSAR